MEFIIIPVEIWDSIPQDIKRANGIDSPRFSTDGAEVMLHLEIYNTLFPVAMTLNEEEPIEPVYPYPVYTNPSLEFTNLLASEEWSSNEEQYDI